MSRETDNVTLTPEERALAATTEKPSASMAALAKFKASQAKARELGLLPKAVSIKGLTPREAIYKFAEDETIPAEQRTRYADLRDSKMLPVDALSESKVESAMTLAMFKEDFVLAVAHDRKLELQDRADTRAEKSLQAAEARKAEAEAKLLAKQGGNTAPKAELESDPTAGTIPTQDESPILTAAEINADIKAQAEYEEREALLQDAAAGVPSSGKGKGKSKEATIAPATDAPASEPTPAV